MTFRSIATASRRAVLAAAIAGAVLGATAAQAQEKVTVGVLRFVSSGGLFLAVEKGYFKQEGLDVELKFFEAAQPIAVAVVSGDTQFGVTAFTGGFYNLAGNGALKIIGAQSKEAKGYEGNLVLASNAAFEKGLTSPDKLSGRSLGVTQVGSSFHYQLGQIATAAKFDIKSVDMKPLQSLPNMVAALKSGQIDSIIIAPHLAKPLVASGDAKLIGRMSDIGDYQFGGLFTATSMITGKRATVEKFARAYQKGMADYNKSFATKDAAGKLVHTADSDKDAALIGKYVYPTDTAEQAIPKVKASAFFADPQARLDIADIRQQIAWMKEQKLVDAAVSADAIIDRSFISGHLNAN